MFRVCQGGSQDGMREHRNFSLSADDKLDVGLSDI